MKRFSLLAFMILLISLLAAPAVAAENFPAQGPVMKNAQPHPGPAAQPRLHYGYVPPPPIRHTWPGGYRVIFHELSNTLVEHMLGQY